MRFRSGNKSYFFDPRGLTVRIGQDVIVETAQGVEYGICTQGNHEVSDSAVVRHLCGVIRMATDADRRTVEYHRRREKDAFDIAEKKIADHGLEMKLVNVSSAFEGNKIIFFFTADGRVDFRALVRDLASVFRSRIELRQIGVRDEARMVGGLGICGRPFCCAQFLDTFLPVSVKMAKTQNLSLNPAKISGACGRLMCCLKYEQHAYEDAARRLPKAESFVQTPDGPGNVKAVDLLRETVRVSLDSDPEPHKTYRVDEIVLLRNGKGGREGIEIPPRPARHVEERREEAFEPVFLDSGWDAPADGPVSGGGNGVSSVQRGVPYARNGRNPSGGAAPGGRGVLSVGGASVGKDGRGGQRGPRDAQPEKGGPFQIRPAVRDSGEYNSAEPYADYTDERHRNRNQNVRRGRTEQRGNGKFQKQPQKRDYPKKEQREPMEGGEKRRGNRNYYRGSRRNRGGRASD